jgi:hypothetical protein
LKDASTSSRVPSSGMEKYGLPVGPLGKVFTVLASVEVLM